MTKVTIISGFLGAGKTTFIRKLIEEVYAGEKIVLIENEYGEIGIDAGFLKDAGVQITEMNSGCICCTLVGDFTKALKQVITDYAPDRILIEPSGVGKLSDVAAAVERVDGAQIGAKITVVDAGKAKMYARNFGEFFSDQVANADLIVMSRTDTAGEKKVLEAAELLKAMNDRAGLITTPWSELNGMQILSAMRENGLRAQMDELREEHEHARGHHHHHDGDDGECECCHHHDDDDTDEHEHHHHHLHHDDDDEECECCHHHHDDDDDDDHDHGHEHHHDHDGHEHHHDHDGHEHHHHHHHADEVFGSWGMETPRRFSEEELHSKLSELEDEEKYGAVLRAKGIVNAIDGEWIYFDYVPGEIDIRRGAPAVTGRFCVIGAKIKEDALKELFNLG